MSGVYVAGTDTGIGKTRVTVALVQALRATGIDAVGMKPVASGCERSADGWRNDDALQLIRAGGQDGLDYARVNPVALPVPASPHIAAEQAGVTVTLPPVLAAHAWLAARHARVLVEGVGGWSVPLAGPPTPWLWQADLVRALDLPVLLVVGLRLGCINHAVLSARAIAADGCRLAGWIGNRLDPRLTGTDQAVLASLEALLPAPCWGVLGFDRAPGPELVAAAGRHTAA